MSRNETQFEMAKLHAIWKLGKKPLKWWKDELAYKEMKHAKFRRISGVPLSKPRSNVSIAIIYQMHLQRVHDLPIHKRLRKQLKARQKKVYRYLETQLIKLNVPVSKGTLFPWKGGSFQTEHVTTSADP